MTYEEKIKELEEVLLNSNDVGLIDDRVHLINVMRQTSLPSPITLLPMIAANPFITDKKAKELYQILKFKKDDDLDGVSTKSDYSPLFLALLTEKKRFSEQLIVDGANPFARLNNASFIDSPYRYPLLVGYKNFWSITAITPFNYLLLLGNHELLLAQQYLKYLNRIKNASEIVEIHIDIFKKWCSDENRKTICDKLLFFVDELKIDSDYKTSLKSFLLEDNISVPGFPLLNRIKIVAEIADFIKRPHSQQQFDTELCGPCVFFSCIAMYAPNVLVHMVMSLLSKGSVDFPIKLKTNSIINKTSKSISLLLYSALKNTYKKSSLKYINESTWPAEIVQWLSNIQCQSIEDATKAEDSVAKHLRKMVGWICKYGIHKKRALVFLDFKSELDRAVELCETGCVILLVHYYALFRKTSEQVFDRSQSIAYGLHETRKERLLKLAGVDADLHWVVLKAIKCCEKNTVNMTIYTHGFEMKFNLGIEDLRSIWLGVLSFNLPNHLVNSDFESLNKRENEDEHPVRFHNVDLDLFSGNKAKSRGMFNAFNQNSWIKDLAPDGIDSETKERKLKPHRFPSSFGSKVSL